MKLTESTVDRNKKNNTSTDNSYTVKQYEEFKSELDQLLEKFRGQPEYVARSLSEKLDDEKSYNYYLLLAKNTSSEILFRALSYTLDTARQNKIRRTKPIYFLAILKRWKIKIKFKVG